MTKPPHTASDGALTKEQWLERCAAHYVKVSDLTLAEAKDFAEACIECFPNMSPEDAAEEDINCWEHE